MRRTLPALIALALGLLLPASAFAAEAAAESPTKERVTEVMLLLIGGLILLGILVAAIEAKRSK